VHDRTGRTSSNSRRPKKISISPTPSLLCRRRLSTLLGVEDECRLSPPVVLGSGMSCSRQSKLLTPPVQAVATAGPSCCRQSKLLLPSVQVTAGPPLQTPNVRSTARPPLQTHLEDAHHRLEYRSIDSCAACVKSFIRT
jgi:hypothetical protein